MSNTRKISLFMQDFSGGGAEKMMVNLANEFALKGFDVDLVVVRNDGPYRKLVKNNVNVVVLGSKKVFFSLWPLMRYLQRNNPVALLATLRHVNILAVLAKILARSSTKVTIREACQIVYKPTLSRADKLAHYLIPYFYSKADNIIAVSDGVKSNILEFVKVNDDKIVSLLNPTITSDFNSMLEAEVNHTWFAENRKVVVSMGRLIDRKRFSDLINAFAYIKDENARLLILGEGPKQRELENLISRLELTNHIEILPFQINPYPYLRRSSLFVLSSEYEGNPNVLIEALASGIQIVSTDCPSGPREILEGGRYGQLVKVGAIDKLANAIEAGLASNSHDQEAQLEYAKNYSADKIASEYLKVLVK